MQNIENANQSEHNNKNKVNITVKYVAGDYNDSFNSHQAILHVFEKAIEYFRIDNTAASKLGLFYNGILLENSKTIEQYTLSNGALLILSSIQSNDIEG